MLEVKAKQMKTAQIKRLVQVPEINIYHVQATTELKLKAIERSKSILEINLC